MIQNNVEYYSNTLPNYETVLEDTNNAIIELPDYSYNCMGYALGTFEWEELESFYCADYFDKDKLRKYWIKRSFKACRRELIRDYKLRPISSPKRACANERVIAFRLGADDFHFARLNSDGTWTHKPGRNTIREMSIEELTDKKGWSLHRTNPYNSKICYFAIKTEPSKIVYTESQIKFLSTPHFSFTEVYPNDGK